MELGTQKIHPWAQLTPESIAAFSYTSGTTGEPKGAMISQLNFVTTIIAAADKIEINETDSYLSYLPMAHVLERNLFYTISWYQGSIGLYGGDVLKLKEDLAILKPTLFASVPRLFNKMYDAISKAFSEKGSCLKGLINKGLNTKLKNLHAHGKTTHWFYDKLVFKKTKDILGGRVKIMITGSAPISVDVIDFLKVAFCAPIIEGYGQTEANAFEFATIKQDGISGNVGGPFMSNEFKLVDVAEMNYTNRDKDDQGRPSPRGEIWVRGPNIIPGYYKNDEKNKETFVDGWLMSGDIG